MQEELDSERVRHATMLFMATTHRHRRVVDKFVVEDLGISNSQHRLLMHLYRTDCTPSQTELAHTFEVSSAAIAVALKKLEKSGYIRRCSAIDDSRYNEITLTDRGLDLVQKTYHMFTAADVAMFESFSESELENFITCLEKMKATLKAIESGQQELPRVKGIHVREIIAAADKDNA